MKFLFTLSIAIILACSSKTQETESVAIEAPDCPNSGLTDAKHINGKPLDFYLELAQIDTTSKDYLQKKHKLYDDDITFAMMDSLDTKNDITRPFYFYIMLNMVLETDGALTEVIGYYIADYVSKYPKELYCNFQLERYSGREKIYFTLIGWNLYEAEEREILIKDMLDNCNDCSDITISEINKYAAILRTTEF